MKDLLSKKHYCCKIHKLLIKSSTFLHHHPPPPTSSLDNSPTWTSPSFLQETLNSSFYDCLNISTPINNVGITFEFKLKEKYAGKL